MHRAWLPPEGAKVSEQFWLQYDQAERFDHELRTEVIKNYGHSYGDPFWNIDGAEEVLRRERIDKAITNVLERNGINCNFQLEDRSDRNSQGQLLLEAA
jgi:hypothetical protein